MRAERKLAWEFLTASGASRHRASLRRERDRSPSSRPSTAQNLSRPSNQDDEYSLPPGSAPLHLRRENDRPPVIPVCVPVCRRAEGDWRRLEATLDWCQAGMEPQPFTRQRGSYFELATPSLGRIHPGASDAWLCWADLRR
jgi:hypothetical protein